jgi:hypothetical protein
MRRRPSVSQTRRWTVQRVEFAGPTPPTTVATPPRDERTSPRPGRNALIEILLDMTREALRYEHEHARE